MCEGASKWKKIGCEKKSSNVPYNKISSIVSMYVYALMLEEVVTNSVNSDIITSSEIDISY